MLGNRAPAGQPALVAEAANLIEYRPRHSAWKNSCDSLAVVGLHENWTLAIRFQVSGVSAASGLKSGQSNLKRNFVLG